MVLPAQRMRGAGRSPYPERPSVFLPPRRTSGAPLRTNRVPALAAASTLVLVACAPVEDTGRSSSPTTAGVLATLTPGVLTVGT